MKEIRDNRQKKRAMENSGFLQQFSFDAADHAHLFQFEAREYIVKEGERPEYLFYLTKGRVKLYSTMPNGRVSLIDFFSAPCFIGEMELVNENYEPKGMQTVERCICLALPMAECGQMLLNDVHFLRNLCTFISGKNYRNIISSTQNQCFPLVNRLAAFILLTQHEGIYKEKHTQASEYLGVSYRHFLLVLAQLTRDGVLEKQGKIYVIKDEKRLKALACEMNPELEG